MLDKIKIFLRQILFLFIFLLEIITKEIRTQTKFLHEFHSTKILRTVTGRATGTSILSDRTLIKTTVVNTQISINNGASASAITITPIAGGTDSVSANLVIRRIS